MEYRDRREKRGSRTERSRSPERRLVQEKDGAQQTPRCASKVNKKLISSILKRIPSCSEGFLLQGTDVPPLKAEECPGFTGVKIRVLEKDPLDAAVELANNTRSGSDTSSNAVTAAGDTPATIPDHGRTCLLNTAIAQLPKDGCGFVEKLKQEKSLYERSTLSKTLNGDIYPVPRKTAVYSPSVVIFGDSQKPTRELKSIEDPASLPLVSVISTPAIVHPNIRAVRTYVVKADRKGVVRRIPSYEQLYHFKSHRRAVKESIRLLLRISASKKHRRIVVSVLGFDEYMHPKEDSANCWAEVFGEPEFQGGWWTDVVFAVLDPPPHPERNYGQGHIYINRLDGLAVSPP